MTMADAQDQRHFFPDLIKDHMRSERTNADRTIKLISDRAGERIFGNQTECFRHFCGILLSLLQTKHPDAFAVYGRYIGLRLPGEINVQGWAAFQASCITWSMDLPEKPLA